MGKNKPRSWTIILTSGAQSPLRQFKIKKKLFYMSFLFICTLFSTMFILSLFLSNQVNEMSIEQEELYIALSERKSEITQLKNEYSLLESEAMAVQQTIEEFKAFEERLSELELDVPQDVESGSGGIEHPVEDNVTSENTISSSLAKIREELPALIDQFDTTIESLLAYQEELKSIPTLMPTEKGRISSEFGERKDPFTAWTSFHSGIDIAAPLNTPIYATANGEVTLADWHGGYGNTIIIDHGNGYETLYAHLNYIDVEVGDNVKKGDHIGGMGTTGRSTGVHLHYEILRDGEHIDPYIYMTFHESQD
ncbi:M23 family metallopeptidase [Evansella cellulosilytica]|uniref:Peptidase M23 n=1 Tax=Evansella cellulosilytica (strain ATCC 21833 / DSM 2522 / FERM P-1141 / JCM 9156 / N-4) TaxID=649639 RepID=E6U105_EVAC2|nr:M23 family metallopeptidase [Evansella cellulosilytica]ADU30317.1 Peptidase M23 [Evansella cellulosilytica DSM 2522]